MSALPDRQERLLVTAIRQGDPTLEWAHEGALISWIDEVVPSRDPRFGTDINGGANADGLTVAESPWFILTKLGRHDEAARLLADNERTPEVSEGRTAALEALYAATDVHGPTPEGWGLVEWIASVTDAALKVRALSTPRLSTEVDGQTEPKSNYRIVADAIDAACATPTPPSEEDVALVRARMEWADAKMRERGWSDGIGDNERAALDRILTTKGDIRP